MKFKIFLVFVGLFAIQVVQAAIPLPPSGAIPNAVAGVVHTVLSGVEQGIDSVFGRPIIQRLPSYRPPENSQQEQLFNGPRFNDLFQRIPFVNILGQGRNAYQQSQQPYQQQYGAIPPPQYQQWPQYPQIIPYESPYGGQAQYPPAYQQPNMPYQQPYGSQSQYPFGANRQQPWQAGGGQTMPKKLPTPGQLQYERPPPPTQYQQPYQPANGGPMSYPNQQQQQQQQPNGREFPYIIQPTPRPSSFRPAAETQNISPNGGQSQQQANAQNGQPMPNKLPTPGQLQYERPPPPTQYQQPYQPANGGPMSYPNQQQQQQQQPNGREFPYIIQPTPRPSSFRPAAETQNISPNGGQSQQQANAQNPPYQNGQQQPPSQNPQQQPQIDESQQQVAAPTNPQSQNSQTNVQEDKPSASTAPPKN